MVQIFDSLKALITPELSKAAATLGESESKVSSAANGILSGILAKILQKGDNQQVENALKDGGKTNILPEISSIFAGNGTSDQEATGNKLVRNLMGDQAGDFTAAVSGASGISQTSANKLTTLIATIVSGFLGNKLVSGNLKMSDLIASLGKEKDRFMSLVPAGVKNAIGLFPGSKKMEPAKKGKNNWLIWLILAIVLILLIIFGWRSCRGRDTMNTMDNNTTVRTEQNMQNTRQNQTTTTTTTTSTTQNRTMKEFTLPNGVKFQSYTGGMEDKMINFLNSNDYKNAKTDNDLKSRWFEFEDVDFARDSATDLDNSARTHLNNVAAILKAYPNAKIRIAGNADKSGNASYNMELSKERAMTVKSVLTNAGIASNRIMTDGFGDENAVWPASATAAQSAPDRDIAFRFMK